MKFKINPEIFKRFPGLNIGVIIVKGLNNTGESEEILKKLREKEEYIRNNYETETLSQNPKIDCWRKAYALFNGKPKENRSSIEALYRRIIKGEELRHINKLVDIYNLISIIYMLPAGGEDLNKTEGNIELAFATANEPSVLLLGERESRPPHEGEVIYKDNISAICRRFNWREADRTKLTEETKNCVLVIEALPPTTKEELYKVTAELKELVEKLCNGKTKYTILNENEHEIEF